MKKRKHLGKKLMSLFMAFTLMLSMVSIIPAATIADSELPTEMEVIVDDDHESETLPQVEDEENEENPVYPDCEEEYCECEYPVEEEDAFECECDPYVDCDEYCECGCHDFLPELPIVLVPPVVSNDGVTYSYDLTDFITGVSITDADGTEIEGNTIYVGQKLLFTFNFAANEVTQFQYNNDGFLTYVLPEVLYISEDLLSEGILAQNNMPLGAFNLNTNNVFNVWFYEVDSTGSPTYDGINFIDRYDNVNFSLQILAQVNNIPGNLIFFGLDHTWNFLIVEPDSELTVTTAATWIGRGAHPQDRFDFTTDMRTVSPVAVRNINMTEVLTLPTPWGGRTASDMFIINPPSNSAITNVRYSVDGGAFTNIDVTYNFINNGTSNYVLESFEYYFEGLALEPNAMLRVMYSVDINILIENNPHLHTNIRGGLTQIGFNEAAYNFTMRNNVRIDSNSPYDVSATIAIRGERRLPAWISKSVSATGGVTTNRTWTATMGNGREIINGEQVTDILDARLTLPADDSIQIRLYGRPTGRTNTNTTQPNPATGALGNLAYTVSFLAANRVLTAQASEMSDYFTRVDDNRFEFIVPSNLGNIYRVVFVYATTHVAPIQGESTLATVTNRIYHGTPETPAFGLTGSGHHWAQAQFSHVFPTVPTTSWPSVGHNSGRGIIAQANGEYIIRYTTTISVPAATQGTPNGNQGRNFWMNNVVNYIPVDIIRSTATPTTAIPVNINPENITVTLNPPDDNFNYTIVMHPDAPNQWEILFGENPIDRASSIWQFTNARTITITYTVPLSSTRIDGVDLETVLRANEASFIRSESHLRQLNAAGNPANVTSLTGSVRTADFWPIFRTVTTDTLDPSIQHHTVRINHRNMNRGNFLGPAADGWSFTDSFDSTLELVPNSLFIRRETNTTQTHFFGPFQGSGHVLGASAHPHPTAVQSSPGGFSVNLRELNTINWAGAVEHFNLASIAATVGAASPNALNPVWDGVDSWALENPTPRFSVHYSTRVIDASTMPDGTVFNFTANVVTADRGNFDDNTSTMFISTPLVKNMIQDGNTNRLEVEIFINQHGARLGAPHYPTRFTARDTMSTNMAFILNTIRLYTQDQNPDGSWNGVWRPQAINPVVGELWSINPREIWEFDLELPNETPVRLTYDVIVTAPQGQVHEVHNSISLLGIAYLPGTPINLTYSVNAFAGGSMETIRIYKQDDVTGAGLQGAEFELYVAFLPNFGVFSGANMLQQRDVNGVTFFGIDTNGITDANGRIDFTVSQLNRTSNFLFLLVETVSPEGYYLPQGEEAYTFFVLAGSPVQEATRTALGTQLGLDSPVQAIMNHVNITNTQMLGTLYLEKEVISDYVDVDMELITSKDFEFTVTFETSHTNHANVITLEVGGDVNHAFAGGTVTLGHGEYARFSNVPIGTVFTIVEDDYLDYGFVSNFVNNTTTVTIEDRHAETVTFINEFTPRTLNISKVVIGEYVTDVEREMDFEFTITFSRPVTFEDNKNFTSGTFTLRHDESVRFTNILMGTDFEVVEADYSELGFESNFPNNTETGTIITQGVENITFVNQFTPIPVDPEPPVDPGPPVEPGGGSDEDDDYDRTIIRPVPPNPSDPTPDGEVETPESQPTPASPDNTLVAYNNMWVEFDDNDVPLGAWTWDDDADEWVFDDGNVPLGAMLPATSPIAAVVALMPQTGITSIMPILVAGLALSILIAAFAIFALRKSKKERI
ncbi:MAG: DUF5979 domain-containing protein [Defluviitaleaceae bacterium]|nr:DUF5979 domain-containing protein [Defluviitaleaceae bacterium]